MSLEECELIRGYSAFSTVNGDELTESGGGYRDDGIKACYRAEVDGVEGHLHQCRCKDSVERDVSFAGYFGQSSGKRKTTVSSKGEKGS